MRYDLIGVLIIVIAMILFLYVCKYVSTIEKNNLRLSRELAKEREKLRLFKLMHPAKRDEECNFYAYEPDGYVVKKDEFLSITDHICEIVTSPEKDADYYGHRIAELLNGDQ